MSITITDTHIRQKALDPTRSFIVQAPAGSGKTEILIQRYLVLLSRAQQAPEEIIAITFTKKTAAEMRARIIQALAFAQTPEPDKNDYRHTTWQLAHDVLKNNHTQHWDLIQNPNRLRILTIDALCAFLCRQTPMLTNFGGLPAICDNAAPLYRLAANRLLTDISNDKKWQPVLEHLLLHLDNQVEKLEKLLSDLLNHRDQWLPHIISCLQNHRALRTLFESSLQRIATEKMQLAAAAMPEHLKQMLIMLVRHAGNYFVENNPEHTLAACADFTFELKPTLFAFSSWFGLAHLLLTQEHTWRKMIDIRSGFAPKNKHKTLMLAVLTELQEHTAFKESLIDIITAPPIEYSALQWETLTALTQLLPLLAAQLTLVFQEQRQIDFCELNLAALKALGTDESPTDLALYLDYQIQHLLIDEFQDTSVTHLHLLEKITSDWKQNDGRTLFVVGDPMQSIYRFRNAEVGLFLRAQQQGIGSIHLESLTLTMNFRSQANCVTWFNNTFSTIFPAVSDIATGRVPYTPACAAKSALENSGVSFYPVHSDRDVDEAEQLVNVIKDTRQKNKHDSIAILVRTRMQLIPIIQLLQEEQLPFQAIDIVCLADRPEIGDLISLTRALLHRADRIAWLAILRAPFCGCLLTDLEIISQASVKKTIWDALLQCENITTLSLDGLNRIKRCRDHLQNAFNTQYQTSVSQWIENTWIHLGGPACLLSETELEYTRAYFNLILKMENESNIISIEQITENVERLFANTDHQSANAIQIMTIHKSKGLEFDHVFLPGLQRQASTDREKLFRWLERPNTLGGNDLILAPVHGNGSAEKSDAIYDYLKLVENQKQDYEMTRLFYVAATRAKKSLHLFALLKQSLRTGSFLQQLAPLYESVINTNISTADHSLDINNQRAPLLLSRLSSQWTSPFTTSTHTESEPVKIDIGLHSQKSRLVGSVIHEIFQSTAQNNLLSSLQWKSRLQSLGILPHEIAECIETIKNAVEKIQSDDRGQWILSTAHTDAKSEWALSYCTDSKTNHVIIDRSFIDANNTRWIIDYKTSTPEENETMEQFLSREKEAYQSQLEQYAHIITQMENRPIRLGIYFPLCAQWIEWV